MDAVWGKVPGIDDGEFQDTAGEAEQTCPVSNALRGNVEINVNAGTETNEEEEPAANNAERRVRVEWRGNLAEGSGSFTESSGVLNGVSLVFAGRTQEGGAGGHTGPEELLAAAHALCYAWTLSGVLTENYQTPERLLIDAMSVFDDEEFKIVTIDIDAQARVTGMEFEDYKNAAYQAEQICPISNALGGNLELRFNAHNFGYEADQ